MRAWVNTIAAAVCMVAFAAPAHATWSITAVDDATGEVGAAGASCTNNVSVIVSLVPGHGAVVAQALTNQRAKRHAAALLSAGASPKAIIETIASPAFDVTWRGQQYGVSALGQSSAAYTGEETLDVQAHVVGERFSVQGNILPDAVVARSAANAFEVMHGPLAKRLMAALEAGADSGGDKRCGAQRARSAFIMVAGRHDTGGKFSLAIKVLNEPQGGRNAVTLLRQRYTSLAR